MASSRAEYSRGGTVNAKAGGEEAVREDSGHTDPDDATMTSEMPRGIPIDIDPGVRGGS